MQYATGLGVRYQEKYQDKLKNLDLDALDVDSGVTDVQLLRSTKLSDTERRIRFSFVGWLTTVHHTAAYAKCGSFIIRIPLPYT